MEKNKQEEGFILVLCMLIMVVLTVIGIAAMRNTTTELQIAGNERLQKKTFYEAEAGATLAVEVLEQNINCPAGFSKTGTSPLVADLDGRVRVNESATTNSLLFYLDPYPWDTEDETKNACDLSAPGSPSISYPIANIGGTEVSNIYVGGGATMLAGGALQMDAGYEGRGKGSAGSGSARFYDIVSVNQGSLNSEATVAFGWQHVIGTEGDCKY